MPAVELSANAAMFAAIIAFIGLAATAIYRFGKHSEATTRIPEKVEVEVRRLDDRMDQHAAANQEEFRHMAALMRELIGRNEDLIRHNEELIRHNEELIRHNEDLIRNNEELIRMESEKTRGEIRALRQAIMNHTLTSG